MYKAELRITKRDGNRYICYTYCVGDVYKAIVESAEGSYKEFGEGPNYQRAINDAIKKL